MIRKFLTLFVLVLFATSFSSVLPEIGISGGLCLATQKWEYIIPWPSYKDESIPYLNLLCTPIS